MKQIYFILLIAIIPFIGSASQSDSINAKELLELKTMLYDNNYLHLLSGQSQNSNIVPNSLNSSKDIKNQKTYNWFGDAWDAFTSLFQPVWGTYTEGGSTNNTLPLATFERVPDVDTPIIGQIINV